jgi:hypothetical protein
MTPNTIRAVRNSLAAGARMSQLTKWVRAIRSRLWPQGRPKIGKPVFKKWNRQAARPQGSAKSRPLSAAELTIEDFQQAPVYECRTDHLYHSLQLAPSRGHVLEFGVFQGGSLNWLAQWCRERQDPRVFGFDSFEGLPHAWVRTKSGDQYDAGHFALAGLPSVVENAVLVPGFFDATLGPWLAEHPGPAAFIHNDSDLYSSTLLTLRLLNGRILPGTIIVLDDLCSWTNPAAYDNWEEGEWKALREWMSEFDRRIAVLSRNQVMGAAIEVVC